MESIVLAVDCQGEVTEKVQYLGITDDRSLSFAHCVDNVVQKVRKAVSPVRI